MPISSGFQNESEIALALNGKRFSDLCCNLQDLISFSFSNKRGLILCDPRGGSCKSDLIIKIGSESHTFSIKKGSGNSIHQEPVDTFLLYLENNFSLPIDTRSNILKFIWGDGTTDGHGNIEDRMSANEFTVRYPLIVSDIRIFLDNIRKDLIKRFLITGVEGVSPAEFIYYGDVDYGVCCSAQDALDWIFSHYSNGSIPVGRLTFQAWNRNINGGDKSEKKRGVIQLKWGTIENDIKEI